MKFHKWSEEDDRTLLKAIDDCAPIFEHFKQQGSTYSEWNAWDAVAGRLLPGICVTGAACRRRIDVIRETEQNEDAWKATIEKVNAYERDLSETTFDGVSELLGNIDALFRAIASIQKDIAALKKAWE